MDRTSIYEYFLKRYDVTLRHPQLPLVQTTKRGVVFPIEILALQNNQKYNWRLDEQQVGDRTTYVLWEGSKRR